MTDLPTVSRIDNIVIGERHRHDLGDISGLAASIDEVGLLHPIVVTRWNVLVAGERRLAACRSLGWDEVPITMAHNLTDAADLLKAEADENVCRKDFLPSEAAASRNAMAELLTPIAAERKGTRTDLQPGGKLPQGSKTSTPRTRDLAATGTGYSARTLDKVDETAAIAADPEIPEPVREVARTALVEMDKTGRVDGFHKAVKHAQSDYAVSQITDAIDRRDPNAAGERERARLKATYSKTVMVLPRLMELDAEAVAFVLNDNEVQLLVGLVRQVTKWSDSIRNAKQRKGLALVSGGSE